MLISGSVALGWMKNPVSSTPNVRFSATSPVMSMLPVSRKRPPNSSLATSRFAGPSSDLRTCTWKVVTPPTSVKVTLPRLVSRPSSAARNACSESIVPPSRTSPRRNPPNPASMRRRRKGSSSLTV